MADENGKRYPQSHFAASPAESTGPLNPRPITSADLPIVDLLHGGTNSRLIPDSNCILATSDDSIREIPSPEEEMVLFAEKGRPPHFGKVDLKKHVTGVLELSSLPKELQQRSKPLAVSSTFPGLALKIDESNKITVATKADVANKVLCTDADGIPVFKSLTADMIPAIGIPVVEAAPKPIEPPTPKTSTEGYSLADGETMSIPFASGDVMEIYAMSIQGGTLRIGGGLTGESLEFPPKSMLRVSVSRENDVIFFVTHGRVQTAFTIICTGPNEIISIAGGTCTIIHHSF